MLPIQPAPVAGDAREPQPPLVQPGRRPRVLLIDDEAHLGVTLSMGLRDLADVASVRSGSEGVRVLLADDRYDLILCDLMMPDLTGMDVFEQVVRERPSLPQPLRLHDRRRGHRAGAQVPRAGPDQRLDKPFRLEQVEALLRRGIKPS